jgi:hypothetical protein
MLRNTQVAKGINFFYTEDQNPIPDEFFSEGVLITSD